MNTTFEIMQHKAGQKPSRSEVTLVRLKESWFEVQTEGLSMGEIGYEPCNGWTAWAYAGNSDSYIDLGSYTTADAAAVALFTGDGYCVEIVSEPSLTPMGNYESVSEVLSADPFGPSFVMKTLGTEWVVSAEGYEAFAGSIGTPTQQFLEFEANNIRPLL